MLIRDNKSHILSTFILFSSIVNIWASIAVAILRLNLQNHNPLLFDLQILVSGIKVCMISIFFFWSCHLIKIAKEPPARIRQLLLL